MRKYFIALLIVIVASCEKECPEPDCVPDIQDGLLAWYPFNGNSNDESGNGNNAQAFNGAHLSADMVGRPNKAAEFDGVDDYFLVVDNGKLNSETVSVSMMVMVKNTNRRHSFISRSEFEDATGVVWGLGQSLDETNVFDFVVKDKSESCSTPHVYDPSSIAATPEQMIAGRWYHVVMIFANGKQELFIDGVLRASKQRAFDTLKQCGNANLVIGGWWKNDIISVDGKLDDIRIYNRVLSTCEIDELSEIFKQ